MEDELLQEAARVLARDERVEAVWAFGSRATGDARPESDVDLAVLARPMTLDEQLRLRSRLTEALARDDIDLVWIDGAPPLLQFEVVRANQRLFAREPRRADEFERRAILRYLDTAWLRATCQRLAREAATR